jgi:ankyrin repeat protein
VDCWAIQGANIANWSGKVDPTKKQLIHWAAYNDMPEVLKEFYKAGADVNQPDEKGNTPIDMAVINKSYSSV